MNELEILQEKLNYRSECTDKEICQSLLNCQVMAASGGSPKAVKGYMDMATDTYDEERVVTMLNNKFPLLKRYLEVCANET